MRLSDYLRGERETLVRHWMACAARLAPPGRVLDDTALRDDAGELLDAIAEALDGPPPTGDGRVSEGVAEYARRHGQTRLAQGFALSQVVIEYRTMRADAMRGWLAAAPGAADIGSVMRFDEVIDEALAESLAWYEVQVTRARELFLGMLGHDLRTPVGAISLSAQALLRAQRLPPAEGKVVLRIFNSAARLREMLDNLLDFTRTRLGGTLPSHRRWSDLAPALLHTVDELRALNPDLALSYQADGDLVGDWDAARLCQLVQNLGGNAMQHGAPGGTVTIAVHGDAEQLTITVHNTGPAIPPALLAHVFDPLMRGLSADDEPHGTRSHLGLGLYICRQIVAAHGGTLDVRSADGEGTRFTARLPRHGP